MIEIVTFTGVDARTDFDELVGIGNRYPFVEFGVLVGDQTCEDNPVFPTLELVYGLKKRLQADRIAIHLCGKYARAAARMEMGERPPRIHAVTNGFGRIQINLHEDAGSPERLGVDAGYLRSFANHSSARRVILQHRSRWENIPVQHPKVEYLFDLSEGRGQEGFEHWPDPPENMRVGYAGGIGPHNIDQAIEFANQHPACPIWIDMERNVRTPDYWFDMDKVRAVCQAVAAMNTRRSTAPL